MRRERMDTEQAFGLRPACEGMARAEVTSLLNRELVRLRLTRRNAYSYWAHEVEVLPDDPYGTRVRVDFMQFEPACAHTYVDAGHVEAGTFTAYEVKSCMADLRSGHGLNFYCDQNFIVMPVELAEPLTRATVCMGPNDKEYDRQLADRTRFADRLLYGIDCRTGKPRFVEVSSRVNARRRRSAAELLMCMLRALIADSDHSDVSHPIDREGGL